MVALWPLARDRAPACLGAGGAKGWMPNGWIPAGDIRRLHCLSTHLVGKDGGDSGGSRHVMEAQAKILLCLQFCSAMKSGLGDENWKSFIIESNKKKVKITRTYNFVSFFSPQKEETRDDFGKKAKNKYMVVQLRYSD